jgi:transposase-like protein
MTDRISRELDAIVREGPGLRKARAVDTTPYVCRWPDELKAEAIRLLPITGMGKRESCRAFGVPWETGRDWLDPGQPKKRPPEEFVEFLFHRAEARRLVRVA